MSDSNTDNNNHNQHSSSTDTNTQPNREDGVPKWIHDPDDTKYVPHALAREYLEHAVRTNKISEGTATNRSATFRQYLLFLADEGVALTDATALHIKSFLASNKTILRQETLSGKLTSIRELYKYIGAYSDEDLEINYFALQDIKPPDSELESMEREPLSKEEIKQLFDALDNPRDRMMVLVGIELGPRNTALRNIKLEDVDLENQEIVLMDEKNGGSYTLPLTNTLTERLRYFIENVRPACTTVEKSPYLFPGDDSPKVGNRRTFAKTVREAAETAGIQEVLGELIVRETQFPGEETRPLYRVTPHALRHTFNNLLEEKDVPREIRARLLNHTTTKTTEEYYDDKEALTEYQDLMEGLLEDQN